MIWRTFLVILFCVISPRALARFELDLLKSDTESSAVRWTLIDSLAGNTQIDFAQTLFTNHQPVRWLEVTPSTNFRHYRQTTTWADKTSTTLDHQAQDYGLEVHFFMLTLAGAYEDTDHAEESFAGSVGLRFIGLTSRSTSLTGRFGWRKRQNLSTSEAWVNEFAEADSQLYLVRWLGLTTRYRYYFPHLSNHGQRLQATSIAAGAFLEFGGLRVFASFDREPSETSVWGGDPVREVRTGVDAGLRLAF